MSQRVVQPRGRLTDVSVGANLTADSRGDQRPSTIRAADAESWGTRRVWLHSKGIIHQGIVVEPYRLNSWRMRSGLPVSRTASMRRPVHSTRVSSGM